MCQTNLYIPRLCALVMYRYIVVTACRTRHSPTVKVAPSMHVKLLTYRAAPAWLLVEGMIEANLCDYISLRLMLN